jgi:ABC-type antimicrobial peptide transport system permease subunit
VHSVAPNFAVEDVATLAALKRDQLSTPALSAGLLTSFAGVALLITLAGIGGMIGTSVTQRTREFGVRLALGARPWSIVWSVLGRGLSLVGVGIAAGLLGAYGFSQVIARYLFHTAPTDLRAYAAVAAVFLAAAALAAFAPARRITRIDPLKVLRND